jgi:hypothetical protein
MLKNNKGSTLLIVSIVVGVLVLGIGGYFGYTWYQDKLLKERISKLEKVEKVLNDLEDSYNNSEVGEVFTPNDLPKYRNATNKVEEVNKKLKDTELDSEIKETVEKCIEDSEGFVTSANRLWNTVESIERKGKASQEDVREIEAIENSINKYNELKACKDAKKDVKDLISKLEK